MRRTSTARGRVVRGVCGFAAFLLLLELLPRTGVVNPAYLPPFSEMMTALGRLLTEPEFWAALGNTLLGWAIGLAIATVLGVALGILIGRIAVLRRYTFSTIEFLRPIPSVALVPLAVLIFGAKMQSTLLLVVYASVWPVLLQVIQGVRDVDPVARDTARSFRFSTVTRVRRLDWPSALPYTMTGLRLAASIALILEITGELLIGSPGIGRLIFVAQASAAVPTMYALVVVAGLLGLGMTAVFRAAQRRTMHWHASERREAAA